MCCFCAFVGLVCDRINDETLEWVSRFGLFSFRLICFCLFFVCGVVCLCLCLCVCVVVCMFFNFVLKDVIVHTQFVGTRYLG